MSVEIMAKIWNQQSRQDSKEQHRRELYKH